MSLPWAKFYWSDWQSEPALRLCSYAARGLWMDLLCIAAVHDPIGYVAVAGRALDETSIARMTGGEESEVGALLGELDRNGVFSRDRQGRIYSRRMVRDAKRAAIARKAGKEGGNPEIRRGTVPKANRVRPYRRSDNPAKTKRIFDRSGGQCYWCNVSLVWKSDELVPNLFHVDHLVPVCDGGSNDEDNLVSACARCNHARARIDWVKPSDSNPDRNSDTNPYIPEARSKTLDPESSLNEETQQNGSVAVRGRASRLPANWGAGGEEIVFAIREGFNELEAFRIAEDFRDFWQAKAGKDGCKLDWPATWRRWVREETKRRERFPARAPAKRVAFV